jgi:membrane-bound lytic murein transglycosylase D
MPHTEPTTRLAVTLPDGRVLRFSNAFLLGRDVSCEVQVIDVQVSRRHAEVLPLRGGWIVRDLQSSNGLFVDGERVDSAPITTRVAVTFGETGPTVLIEPEVVSRPQEAVQPSPAPPPLPDEGGESLEEYAQRYFKTDGDEDSVGGRTLMIRKAFRRVQAQQKRRHRMLMGAAAVLVLAVGAYAYREHRRAAAQEATAEAIFYQMKLQDVRFAELEQQMASAGASPDQQQAAKYLSERRQMETNYEQYAAKLYDRKLNEKDRLILRVTRMFGECELAAPPDYIDEVNRYIHLWQSTPRFARAVKLANDLGYTRKIAGAFTSHGLPAQYFYLAMQESSFNTLAVGPPTRFGYAKGMWQFIPPTANTYGLRLGPLSAVPRADPMDERFNWEKATDAAARYVKNIYATDAQASGLLVMASYNWGEGNVIQIVRGMPKDPRERNFWQLLAKYRRQIPGQTYDYVFSIVSAAVIGENPRLFGFQFDNPLAFAEPQ